ncbi:M23 family metallopeptidase [Nonlabens xiamenensis]|uniref:M23 family metallopeptidase n=1 Tax=Nonlabens xiamenensis TaxID=2341043 RepID=UPI0021D06FAC|nr:peptidoglycan DD-metalloendopeptidase family protein [Nonlabens xiamenensis]
MGDPIYAVGAGKVIFAEDLRGGWGKLIEIIHHLPDQQFVESLYAHCDSMLVTEGDLI